MGSGDRVWQSGACYGSTGYFDCLLFPAEQIRKSAGGRDENKYHGDGLVPVAIFIDVLWGMGSSGLCRTVVALFSFFFTPFGNLLHRLADFSITSVQLYEKKDNLGEKKGLLRIKEGRRDYEIYLTAPGTSIVKYHPFNFRFWRRFPGDGFELLYISDGTHTVKISNLEFSDYGLDEVLEHHPNYKIKKRQFNFLFW